MKRYLIPQQFDSLVFFYFQKYGDWPITSLLGPFDDRDPWIRSRFEKWVSFVDDFLGEKEEAEKKEWDSLGESHQKSLKEVSHRAVVTDDGSDTVVFKWHWPRGTFDRRMSALEIANFVLPHMGAILDRGILQDHPKVQAEFAVLLNRLALWPQQVLDEVVPWIRRLDFTEEDEILLLDLGAKQLPPEPVHFVLGAK
jgi:hypothetical protein